MNMSNTNQPSRRLPVLFLSHGGGPCFFMNSNGDEWLKAMGKDSDAAKWYKQLATQVRITDPPADVPDKHLWQKPKAILIISAHWETDKTIFVTNQDIHKELFYDYYGFPDFTYELKYPARGKPDLAKRVVDLVRSVGIKIEYDNKRNFDHGVFVPLLLMYPKADIPVVEMSINSNFDPLYHLKIGEALQPLRDEGVLIIGSGHSTHGRFSGKRNLTMFINAFVDTLTNKNAIDRRNVLVNWEKLPFAREAHRREEHLIPLHVAVGAAGNDRGYLLNDHTVGDLALHSFSFQ